MPLRKLEPDAELVASTDAASGPFLTAAAMTLQRFASLGLKSGIAATPSMRQVEQFRLRKVVAATMTRPIPIFVAAKQNGPPAA